MSTPTICPVCGTPLHSDAPRGLCARCLLTPPPQPAQSTICNPQSALGTLRYFGDYELLEEIARGGMGVVYKARQVSLNRTVAVKMILSGQLASAGDVARFRAEAEAAANLQHPNIVAIHEVGEHEGHHYFSMDYVEGRNLAELVRDGPLPAKRAVELIRTIAEAIHYAHGRGVLHRDIKPSNILIDDFDEPRVTDFGLAKRFGVPPSGGSDKAKPAKAGTPNLSESLTLTGHILGTPNFMSPEQARGRGGELGPHSDVYSLGGILFFLLTARAPFLGETIEETLHQVLTREAISPRLLNPSVPRDLETICLKCLEKDPRRRYGTAQELADELGRFLLHEPIHARPIAPADKLWRWCRRYPAIASLTSVVALLVLIVAAGSSIFAARLHRANREARDHLRESYLDQARALRWSGRPGRRFDSLEALRKAAAIRPSLELRNEAIGCIALADLRVIKEWDAYPTNGTFGSFDANYERYVFADAQGTVHVRRLQDEAELAQFPGYEPPFHSIEFTPDGHFLFVACGKNFDRVEILDLVRREVILRLSEPTYRTRTFSADSRMAAISYSNKDEHFPIRIFDLTLNKEAASFHHDSLPFHLRFDRKDPRRLLTSDESPVVRLWNWETGREVQRFTHPDWVRAIDLHPDGNLVATGCADGKVRLWDTATGRERWVMGGHQGTVVTVIFSPDGAFLASLGWDLRLRLWDPVTGQALLSKFASGSVYRFSQTGYTMGYANGPGKMGTLEVAKGNGYRVLRAKEDQDVRTRTCAFSRDGRILVSSHEEHIRFWDIVAEREIAFCPGMCADAAFHPDGQRLFAWTRHGVQECQLHSSASEDMITLQPTRQFATKPVEISLNRDGTLLGGIPDGSHFFDLLDLLTGQVKLRLEVPARHAYAALSPDGKLMASWQRGGDGQIVITDLASTQIVARLPIRNAAKAMFSPNGRWLASGDSTEHRLWDTATWKPIYTVPRLFTDYWYWSKLAFSEDSSMLAVPYSRDVVRLLDAATGRELATLEAPEAQNINWLAFSPDGTQLAVASAHGPIHLWNLGHIRQQLAAMKLDWNLPPLAPPAGHEGARPMTLTFLGVTNSPPAITPAIAPREPR
jgi:serine/threonine protein kinase/WD40 repeat protein